MLRWTLHLKGEPQRSFYAAVAVGNEVYAFGADVDDGDRTEVFVFNTVSLHWVKLTPETPGRGERPLEGPDMRWGHTAVLIEYTVYIWGSDLLHAFHVDARRWFKPAFSGTIPDIGGFHSACVLRKVMYIHGGWAKTGRTNEIYKFDTSTMVWTLIHVRGTPPPPLVCHSATIIGTKMCVFGGSWGDQYQSYNTISVFDTETGQWLNTPTAQLVPKARHNHSAFTYNGELYIFGGYNYTQTFNDVWKFSPETFSWKKVEPKGKGPPSKSLMCCCMMGDSIILFGGYNTPDDLYVLDFSTSLKTLCKLGVIQYSLEQSELPHDTRWELAAMTSNHIC